ARGVVYGFNLGPVVGMQLLVEHYNPRCVPPWSEAELRHKALEADSKPYDKPRGYLLGVPTAGPTPTGQASRGGGPAGSCRAGSEKPTPGLVVTSLADVRIEPIHWLVEDLLPEGKLVTFAGDGGEGKSAITLHLAAAISAGRRAFGLNYEPPAAA